MATSKPKVLTIGIPGYPNTPEEKDIDHKPHFTKMIEAFKEGINNSLKEIQKNTIKQVKI